MHRRLATIAVAAASGLALSACGSGPDETPPTSTTAAASSSSSSSDHAEHGAGSGAHAEESGEADHGAHQHATDGGPPPEDIAADVDPAFPVGTDVVLAADHMPGMQGAPATITGAFDTTTYSVTYTPTDGGEPVVDHKWVVHEELESPGPAPLPDGTEVILRAEHMPGMNGATATIDSSTQEPVYMVDVHSDEMPMTNHKWVTEAEVRPAP